MTASRLLGNDQKAWHTFLWKFLSFFGTMFLAQPDRIWIIGHFQVFPELCWARPGHSQSFPEATPVFSWQFSLSQLQKNIPAAWYWHYRVCRNGIDEVTLSACHPPHKLSGNVTMASKKETCKKKNYSEAEIDVLLMEEQMRAKTLFESLSGGVG